MPEAARRILARNVRIGRPMGVSGLPTAAKGPAFSTAVGLMIYPQVADMETHASQSGLLSVAWREIAAASPGMGQWLKEELLRKLSELAGVAMRPEREGTGTMTIKLQKPDITELKPRITVFGVGGGGGNAVNNMISAGLQGVDFVVANTDAQALTMTKAERIIQLGASVTEGLGAGSQPEVGRAAAEECIDEIVDHLNGTHMCFVTAGMGGGTGTGAAPVVAQAARNKGILTVGVVTKPFHFEGGRRMRLAESGIQELQKSVDTLIVIPNQNLFRIANDKTTFADAFAMADQVLYSGVACITDLMVKEGLINLDFADVRSVMREMGRAMMGTGEASGPGPRDAGCRSGDRQPAARRNLDEGRTGPADLHHRRSRSHPLRSRRSGNPHPRRSRSGRQHHPRRNLRRIARRHHPRLGRRHRHRPRDEPGCRPDSFQPIAEAGLSVPPRPLLRHRPQFSLPA